VTQRPGVDFDDARLPLAVDDAPAADDRYGRRASVYLFEVDISRVHAEIPGFGGRARRHPDDVDPLGRVAVPLARLAWAFENARIVFRNARCEDACACHIHLIIVRGEGRPGPCRPN
jgi:hypothetical protein